MHSTSIMYNPAVMSSPSPAVWCTIRRLWSWCHCYFGSSSDGDGHFISDQCRFDVWSSDDEHLITADVAFDPATMITSSSPVWRLIQRWWSLHHSSVVWFGGDVLMIIIAGLMYHQVKTMLHVETRSIVVNLCHVYFALDLPQTTHHIYSRC